MPLSPPKAMTKPVSHKIKYNSNYNSSINTVKKQNKTRLSNVLYSDDKLMSNKKGGKKLREFSFYCVGINGTCLSKLN